jgi:hypothetical protein
MDATTLVHPGMNDPVYKARRNQIAELGQKFRTQGGAFPVIDYSEEENRTWSNITKKLAVLHRDLAGSFYLKARDLLPYRY